MKESRRGRKERNTRRRLGNSNRSEKVTRRRIERV